MVHPVETQVRGVTNPVGDAHPEHFRPQRLVPRDPRGTHRDGRKPDKAAVATGMEAPAFVQRAQHQLHAQATGRSEARRVGKECGSTCRSWWSPYHYKKKHTQRRATYRYKSQEGTIDSVRNSE